MKSLYDRISKGKISVDEITKSMERSTSAGGKYFQSMEKQSKTFNGMMSTLKDNAMGFLGAMTENVSKGMTKDLIPTALKYVDILNSELEKRGIQGAVNAVGLILGTSVVEITSQAPKVVESALGLIGTFFGAISQNAYKIGENAVEVVAVFTNGIISSAPKVAQAGIDLLNGVAKGITDSAPTIIPQALDSVAQLIKLSDENKESIGATGADIVASIGQGLFNGKGDLSTIAENLIESVFNPERLIEGVFKGFFERIGEKIVDKIKEGFTFKWSGMKDFIENAFDFLLKILDLDDLVKGFVDLGKYMAEGIKVGFENNIAPIIKVTKWGSGKILDAAKDFFKIKSPSRVMADKVGQYLPLGIARGFIDKMPLANRQMKTSMGGLVSAMQGKVQMASTVTGTSKMIYSNDVEQQTNQATSLSGIKEQITNAFDNTKVILDKREVGRVVVLKGV